MAKATLTIPTKDPRVPGGSVTFDADIPREKANDDTYVDKIVSDYIDSRYGPADATSVSQLTKNPVIAPKPDSSTFAGRASQVLPGPNDGDTGILPGLKRGIQALNPISFFKSLGDKVHPKDPNNPTVEEMAATLRSVPGVSDISRLAYGDVAGEAASLVPGAIPAALAAFPKARAVAPGFIRGMSENPSAGHITGAVSRSGVGGIAGAGISMLTHHSPYLGAATGALTEAGLEGIGRGVKGAINAVKATDIPGASYDEASYLGRGQMQPRNVAAPTSSVTTPPEQIFPPVVKPPIGDFGDMMKSTEVPMGPRDVPPGPSPAFMNSGVDRGGPVYQPPGPPSSFMKQGIDSGGQPFELPVPKNFHVQGVEPGGPVHKVEPPASFMNTGNEPGGPAYEHPVTEQTWPKTKEQVKVSAPQQKENIKDVKSKPAQSEKPKDVRSDATETPKETKNAPASNKGDKDASSSSAKSFDQTLAKHSPDWKPGQEISQEHLGKFNEDVKGNFTQTARALEAEGYKIEPSKFKRGYGLGWGKKGFDNVVNMFGGESLPAMKKALKFMDDNGLEFNSSDQRANVQRKIAELEKKK